MLNVIFMGNHILVPENIVSRYAIENGVSLEDAVAIVNVTQVFSFENVEDDLVYLLKRNPTLEEILACQWVQQPVDTIDTNQETLINHEHNGNDANKIKVSNLDTEGAVTLGSALVINEFGIPVFSTNVIGNRGKYSKQLDSLDLSNGYIDLPHLALPNSLIGYLNRVSIHEGSLLDYTVQNSNNVSRVTLVNSIANGLEAAEINDYLHFSYFY